MEQETLKTVSVEMAADLLKELAQVGQEVKEVEKSTDEQAVITLQVTPEQFKALTKLREDIESYQRSQIDERRTETDQFIKISQMRISFYEKVILLAGGSFALSLTFLGLLHSHAAKGAGVSLAAMGKYKAVWILLLVSIVFGWLHNLYRCGAVDSLMAVTWKNTEAAQRTLLSQMLSRAHALFRAMESPTTSFSEAFLLLEKAIKNLNRESAKDSSKYIDSMRKFSHMSAALGALALILIIIAFVLMTIFAIKNVALL